MAYFRTHQDKKKKKIWMENFCSVEITLWFNKVGEKARILRHKTKKAREDNGHFR